MNEGHFVCFSCGARGHDLIDFVRRCYNLNFEQACRELGCWDDSGRRNKKLKRVVVGRDLVIKFTIDGTEYEARVHDDPADWRGVLRCVYWMANDRLTEIGRGDFEKFEGEAETCWQILADTLPQLREAERA